MFKYAIEKYVIRECKDYEYVDQLFQDEESTSLVRKSRHSEKIAGAQILGYSLCAVHDRKSNTSSKVGSLRHDHTLHSERNIFFDTPQDSGRFQVPCIRGSELDRGSETLGATEFLSVQNY